MKDRGAQVNLQGHCSWSNHMYTEAIRSPWTGSDWTTCWQQVLNHNVAFLHLWFTFEFCVLTERLWDVHAMGCTATPHTPLPIWHQVDFNDFMENSGMPCWWRGFWVMEGFVKLLQRLEQGPYRHLPSLWRTQWDCTDPGGSNGY